MLILRGGGVTEADIQAILDQLPDTYYGFENLTRWGQTASLQLNTVTWNTIITEMQTNKPQGALLVFTFTGEECPKLTFPDWSLTADHICSGMIVLYNQNGWIIEQAWCGVKYLPTNRYVGTRVATERRKAGSSINFASKWVSPTAVTMINGEPINTTMAFVNFPTVKK